MEYQWRRVYVAQHLSSGAPPEVGATVVVTRMDGRETRHVVKAVWRTTDGWVLCGVGDAVK